MKKKFEFLIFLKSCFYKFFVSLKIGIYSSNAYFQENVNKERCEIRIRYISENILKLI